LGRERRHGQVETYGNWYDGQGVAGEAAFDAADHDRLPVFQVAGRNYRRDHRAGHQLDRGDVAMAANMLILDRVVEGCRMGRSHARRGRVDQLLSAIRQQRPDRQAPAAAALFMAVNVRVSPARPGVSTAITVDCPLSTPLGRLAT